MHKRLAEPGQLSHLLSAGVRWRDEVNHRLKALDKLPGVIEEDITCVSLSLDGRGADESPDLLALRAPSEVEDEDSGQSYSQ